MNAPTKPHSRAPHPVDLHVGMRIRAKRKMRQLSQTDLAHALGLTFQQVQKYERGSNRVSASMLLKTARYLETPIAWFFEDVAGGQPLQPEAEPVMELAAVNGGVELARVYVALTTDMRTSLLSIARAMGGVRALNAARKGDD